MARIFLSHSSANNAEAIAVRDWLIAHGWEDIFLDLDPERGLKTGQAASLGLSNEIYDSHLGKGTYRG